MSELKQVLDLAEKAAQQIRLHLEGVEVKIWAEKAAAQISAGMPDRRKRES